jgi:hypothetical protein
MNNGKVTKFDQDRPKVFNTSSFYLGHKRRQLTFNSDPDLIMDVRAYLYAQNFSDVARPGVDQKNDREVMDSALRYLRDQLANPNSGYYREGYYEGSTEPVKIPVIHDRIQIYAKNREWNGYIEAMELFTGKQNPKLLKKA